LEQENKEREKLNATPISTGKRRKFFKEASWQCEQRELRERGEPSPELFACNTVRSSFNPLKPGKGFERYNMDPRVLHFKDDFHKKADDGEVEWKDLKRIWAEKQKEWRLSDGDKQLIKHEQPEYVDNQALLEQESLPVEAMRKELETLKKCFADESIKTDVYTIPRANYLEAMIAAAGRVPTTKGNAPDNPLDMKEA
jgi:hypothetical protein